MASSGVGEVEVDFGAFPGSNTANSVVTGLPDILSTAKVEAWIMATTSTNHDENDHVYASLYIKSTCGNIVAGTGFTIYCLSPDKLEGKFKIQYVWVNP